MRIDRGYGFRARRIRSRVYPGSALYDAHIGNSRCAVPPRNDAVGLRRPCMECHLSHTIREKTKLLNRVRRIRGQVEAVERALEQEIGCSDVLQLIAGARGAINGLMAEVMEDHIRAHVIDPAREPDAERAHAAEELIDVVRSYLK